MSENIAIDDTHLTELIRNPTVVRIVSILDLASLSILELLEYNLDRREINYALSERVIAIDKLTTSSPASSYCHPTIIQYIISISGRSSISSLLLHHQ
jgi:hypothetical protein